MINKSSNLHFYPKVFVMNAHFVSVKVKPFSPPCLTKGCILSLRTLNDEGLSKTHSSEVTKTFRPGPGNLIYF